MDKEEFYDIPLFISNPLYQMVAVILVIKYCSLNKNKTATIGKLQLYLWGLSSKRNLEKLTELRKNGTIDEYPFFVDVQIMKVMRQMIRDGYILPRSDSNTTHYGLTTSGEQFLIRLEQTELCRDIKQALDSIGKIPEKIILKLNINWYD